MPFTTSPTLNADDLVSLVQYAKLDGILDTPLEASINIKLPILLIEVRLLLRIEKRIDSSVKVRVLDNVSRVSEKLGGITDPGCSCIASDHDDRAQWAVLGDHPGRLATARG